MANPVFDDDQLAAAIGRAVAQWALADMALEMIFHALLGSNARLASLVFSFFKSAQTQRDIVLKLAQLHFPTDNNCYVSLKELLNWHGSLYAKRNQLFHNAFGYDTTDEERPLYQMTRSKDLTRDFPFERRHVSISDIESFTDDATKLADALLKCRITLYEALSKRRSSLETSQLLHPHPNRESSSALPLQESDEEPEPPPQSSPT